MLARKVPDWVWSLEKSSGLEILVRDIGLDPLQEGVKYG